MNSEEIKKIQRLIKRVNEETRYRGFALIALEELTATFTEIAVRKAEEDRLEAEKAQAEEEANARRKKSVTVYLDSDEPQDPRDDDGNWTPYSFSPKHVQFQHPYKLGLSLDRDNDGIPKVKNPGLRRKLEVGLAFFLSYYEHGNCRWSLLGGGPTCAFDSVRVAGLLVWEHGPGDMGAKTYEDREKDAERFLESWTDWCNGHSISYRIEDENGDIVDSCGGYYASDSDYMSHEIVATIKRDGLTVLDIKGDMHMYATSELKELKELEVEEEVES